MNQSWAETCCYPCLIEVVPCSLRFFKNFMAKGYWISIATVINPELFGQYVEKVVPFLASVDGTVFGKDQDPVGKERTEDANLAVIIEFPSKKAAVEAYESTEYQEIGKIRKAATKNATFTIMEGF